ncbi:MAG: hypothetical protein WBG46_01960 [Nonlabens sp.]
MRIKILIILIGLFFALSSTEVDQSMVKFKVLLSYTVYQAGDNVSISFNGFGKKDPNLIVNYSIGTVVIKGKRLEKELSFKIPNFIAQQSGLIHWQLQDTNLTGAITILPKTESLNIESYLGPTRLNPDTGDRAMFINTPLDVFDNPIEDQNIEYSYYIGTSQNSKTLDSVSLASFDYLPQLQQKQTVFASAVNDQVSSKEFELDYTAGFPVEFTLSRKRDNNASRDHNYADGNQIMEVVTSTIKDQYGNTVDNGTRVDFYAQRPDGTMLKTKGTTIDGAATGRFLHPEQAMSWSVYAEVPYHAQSDTIEVDFITALQDYEVSYDAADRLLTAGPLRSYMGQLYPDGQEATISFDTNGKTRFISKQSENGFIKLDLDEANITEVDKVNIEIAGVAKTIQIK